VSVAERIPSTGWVSLTHGGDEVAEAWSMPDGDAVTVVFLVPRRRLEGDDPARRATVGALLDAAGIPPAAVAWWRLGDATDPGGPDPGAPLPPPAADETHLTVYVRLRPDGPSEAWQAVEALWKTVLGLEAGIDVARLAADGLRGEMEAEFRRPLTVEEKLHALQADVAAWTKAKSRVHFALPKAREFVHRATWAAGVPERVRLEEVFRAHIEPRVPFPGLDGERDRLDHLQKGRQVLAAQGAAVLQECRGILAEVQRALATLRRNAADRAQKKRSAGREKGKHF
jgi:hypothetical protein